MSEIYRPGLSHCPRCHTKLDAAASFDTDARAPAAGDVTICMYCETLLVYRADLQLAELTEPERAAMTEEEQADQALVLAQVRTWNARIGRVPLKPGTKH